MTGNKTRIYWLYTSTRLSSLIRKYMYNLPAYTLENSHYFKLITGSNTNKKSARPEHKVRHQSSPQYNGA